MANISATMTKLTLSDWLDTVDTAAATDVDTAAAVDTATAGNTATDVDTISSADTAAATNTAADVAAANPRNSLKIQHPRVAFILANIHNGDTTVVSLTDRHLELV